MIFYFQESGRAYEVDDSIIEIPNLVLNKIEVWNREMRHSIEIDRKVVLAVLMSLVTSENIKSSKICADVINIIHGNYKFEL